MIRSLRYGVANLAHWALYIVLDHEVVRLREENRELEEQLVASRQNTITVVREQNQLIDRLHDQCNTLRAQLGQVVEQREQETPTGTYLDYKWTERDLDQLIEALRAFPVYMGDPKTRLRLIIRKIANHDILRPRLLETLNNITGELARRHGKGLE